MSRIATPMKERFWDKVDIPCEPDECWEWNAATRNGYGVIGRPGSGSGIEYAHRIMFTIFHGQIPEGREICHICNNRLCVNFTHLYAGTRGDNMAQAWRDGSGKVPNRWKPGTFHRNPNAK